MWSMSFTALNRSVCYLPDEITPLKAVGLMSLSVVTVVLNSLVIITIWKDPFKELKGTANYLILNLAVCDLLVGFPAELLFALVSRPCYYCLFRIRCSISWFLCFVSYNTGLGSRETPRHIITIVECGLSNHRLSHRWIPFYLDICWTASLPSCVRCRFVSQIQNVYYWCSRTSCIDPVICLLHTNLLTGQKRV